MEKGTAHEAEVPPETTPSVEPEATPSTEPEPTPTPEPSPEQISPYGGAGCARIASSLPRESSDFSPFLIGVVWAGAALALGKQRKRNK